MRVTIVTETYAPQVNGVSRTLGQLVRVLEATGDAVQLIHPNYGGEPTGPHVHRVRSFNPPFYPELYLPTPPFGAARRALDQFRPDILHIATEATLGLAMLRHAWRRKLPVVSSFHTNFDQYTDHYRVGWMRRLVWRYLRWFHNGTLETYVPSRASIRILDDRGFRNLVLWPRGVDSQVFRPDRPGRDRIRASLGFAPETFVVGHVSRLAAEKNVGYLAEAFEVFLAARPEARLLIVGDGPARPELEARLGTAARFAGYRSGDDLADHYAAADAFAFASRTETFGNVVLEAMAAGLAVVAVRSGGPADTIRAGETGFLVEPDDPPEAFARDLVALHDDPDLRVRLGHAARSYACTQSWETIMQGLRARYEAVLERRAAA